MSISFHYMQDISKMNWDSLLTVFSIVQNKWIVINIWIRAEFFTVFYGLELFLNPFIFEWQNASGCLSFWIIFSNNIKMFLAPLISQSIVIPHSLLLQRRTLLISFPLNFTFAISQWQWHHNLDVWNSSTSTNSHHFCNLFFTSCTGPLWWPCIILSLGFPQFPKPTITSFLSNSDFLVVILCRIFTKVFCL